MRKKGRNDPCRLLSISSTLWVEVLPVPSEGGLEVVVEYVDMVGEWGVGGDEGRRRGLGAEEDGRGMLGVREGQEGSEEGEGGGGAVEG